MSPFQLIKSLTSSKRKWEDLSEEDKNSFNVFMTHRILSMDRNYVDVVNYLQLHYNIPKEQVYSFYYGILPEKDSYARYIKKSKEEHNEKLLEILAGFYECSQREVKSYLRILSPDKINHILFSLGYDSKEIKKLMK